MKNIGILKPQYDYVSSLVDKDTVNYGNKQAVANTLIAQHEQFREIILNRKLEQTDKEILFMLYQTLGVKNG